MSMRVCHWGVVMRLAGCARVHTTYTPAKSEYVSGKRQSVRMARVAYPGDLPELLKFGGEVLGRIDAAGNGFAGQGDVEERIRRDAAELGATHVVFISSYEEEDHLPVQYHTQCAQGSCTTTTSGGERFTRPHAGYVLVRVPHGRWEELPPALGGLGKQPELGRVSQGKQPGEGRRCALRSRVNVDRETATQCARRRRGGYGGRERSIDRRRAPSLQATGY
jgi:hypothetical protein